MTILKRLVTSMKVNFDWMVTQVENHEGLISAAVAEVPSAYAKAKVQYKRMQQDRISIQNKIAKLTEEEKAWSDRAIQSSALDESKALECVRRLNRCKAEKQTFETQLNSQKKVEEQLTKDLHLIEERLEQLKRQRNVLRTRQSRAEALRAANLDETGVLGEVDSILERWETKVTEVEIQSQGLSCEQDDFAREIVAEEEEQSLRATLATLKATSQNVNQ